MGFSSLAVMANSLLLQFEGRPPRLPAKAAPAQPTAAPAAAAEEKQQLAPGRQAGENGSGGAASQVSPA